MRRFAYLLALIAVALAVAAALLSVQQRPACRRFAYRLEVEVEGGWEPLPLAEVLELRAFPNTTRQESRVVAVEYRVDGGPIHRGYRLSMDEDGNPIIELTEAPSSLPPNSTFNAVVVVEVVVRPRPMDVAVEVDEAGGISAIPPRLREALCRPTSLWRLDDPEVSSLAHKLLVDDNVLLTVTSFTEWIDANVRYPSNASRHLSWLPSQTVRELEGDCDDRANLLIALCRCVGIPSYLQFGVVYEPGVTAHLDYGVVERWSRSVGWHGWAVVYVPPWGWLPVDLTYFEGCRRVVVNGSLYVRAEDPLDHIVGSPIARGEPIIVAGNITSIDYMQRNLRLIELLRRSGAVIVEREELVEL